MFSKAPRTRNQRSYRATLNGRSRKRPKIKLDPIIELELRYQEETAHHPQEKMAVEIARGMAEAFSTAGMDAAWIYATAKTGSLPTEENIKFMPKEHLQEWLEAVEEYNRLARSQTTTK